MSLILAIEPDARQAEFLARMLPDRVGAALLMAESAEAAVAQLDGRSPDVLLLGRALSDDDQHAVLARLSARQIDVSDLPRLVIPELRIADAGASRSWRHPFDPQPETSGGGADPARFADEVAACVAGASQRAPRTAGRDTPAEDLQVESDWQAWVADDGLDLARASLVAAEPNPSRAVDRPSADPGLAFGDGLASSSELPDDDPFSRELQALLGQMERAAAEASPAPVAREPGPPLGALRAAEPDAGAAPEAPVPFDAARMVPLDAGPAFSFEVLDETAADRPRPGDPFDAAPDELFEAASDEVSIDLAEGDDAPSAWRAGEAPIDPEVHAAELALAEVRAEERLASEVERVRAEAAARHAQEVARLEAEAAAAREAAVVEARAAAEAEARTALTAELQRVRGEAEHKLASELSRVRAEAAQNLAEQIGQTRAEADHVLETELARAQVEADAVRTAALAEARTAAETTAARAMAAEVSRARAETEARLEAELARVRAEAERERLAHEQAELRREHAAREARVEAEAEAARRVEVEVERVKAEADARLNLELARMQEQAEERWFAPREGRIAARPDASSRDDAAHGAREAEAARALEAEMAQARADAAAQLQAQLAQLRAEADEARRARAAAERRADEQRGAAAREAREAAERAVQRTLADESARVREEAEARLAAETARVRSEAEARLAAELAAFSAETERRRQEELRQMRSQMARLRDAALFQEPPLTEEMVIAGGGYIGQAPMSRKAPRRSWLLDSAWPRHAALIAVVLAATSFMVDVPSIVRYAMDRVMGAVAAARSSDAPAPAPETPPGQVANDDPPAPGPTPRRGPSPTRPPGASAVSGTLAVFSRIPLDIYAENRRIGTSEGPVPLAPGWHALRLVSNRYNYREEISVEIRAGASTTHSVTLPTGLLRVRSSPGAEVWVEGELAGRAPVVEVEVPIGTREVAVRHPQLGARRTSVEIRSGLTADVILPLEREAGAALPATPDQLVPLSRPSAGRPSP